jgi:hypothetical protein
MKKFAVFSLLLFAACVFGFDDEDDDFFRDFRAANTPTPDPSEPRKFEKVETTEHTTTSSTPTNRGLNSEDRDANRDPKSATGGVVGATSPVDEEELTCSEKVRKLISTNALLSNVISDLLLKEHRSKEVTSTSSTIKTSATTTTGKPLFKIDDDDFAWFETTTPTNRPRRDYPIPIGVVRYFFKLKKL